MYIIAEIYLRTQRAKQYRRSQYIGALRCHLDTKWEILGQAERKHSSLSSGWHASADDAGVAPTSERSQAYKRFFAHLRAPRHAPALKIYFTEIKLLAKSLLQSVAICCIWSGTCQKDAVSLCCQRWTMYWVSFPHSVNGIVGWLKWKVFSGKKLALCRQGG